MGWAKDCGKSKKVVFEVAFIEDMCCFDLTVVVQGGSRYDLGWNFSMMGPGYLISLQMGSVDLDDRHLLR